MKNDHLIFSAERLFLRSCLETGPAGGRLRGFNWNGDGARRFPTRLFEIKQRLLHAALERTSVPRAQKELCGAANAAAAAAWETSCPLLVYPCLFEEMAGAVLDRHALGEPMDEAADNLSLAETPAQSWR